jgi:ABC-2 type transport system permease protein
VAVHKRAYRPYDGPLTAERWRFLVLPRYAFRELFESRVLMVFLVLCCIPFLVEVAVVYIANTAAARVLLGIPEQPDVMRAEFFFSALTMQGALAFFLTAWVAPVLVSPDLVNGALPLYLSRPLSRGEYVLGKATVLLTLLSGITWVPQLILCGLQAGLAGSAWWPAHLRIGMAIFVGSWLWILVLTLLGLAISSWIRWRFVASGALFAVFFMGAAFGEMWRQILRNSWGQLLNVSYMIGIVWHRLFGSSRVMALRPNELPAWVAVLGLLAVCGFSLWLLNRRLQAREVVA